MNCQSITKTRFSCHSIAALSITCLLLIGTITGCGGGGEGTSPVGGGTPPPSGGGGTPPPVGRNITGTYILDSVNGESLPAAVFDIPETGVSSVIIGGELVIQNNEEHVFTSSVITGAHYKGAEASRNYNNGNGFWSVEGDTVKFRGLEGVGPGKMTLLPDGSLSRIYNYELPLSGSTTTVTEIWKK